MAFLDNSGDIILDAVLTDTGRQLLAGGDGSFNIHSFALGDDEIDYGLYNTEHTGGTEYFDLEILQTPILEAFTNNMSSMKSKLVTFASNDLLFLPSLILNDGKDPGTGAYKGMSAVAWKTYNGNFFPDGFIVAVDQVTEVAMAQIGAQGILRGESPINKTKNSISGFIRVEQGFDTDEISPINSLKALFPELVETQYYIEIDSRLGKIVGTNGAVAPLAYIDDDLIAVYKAGVSRSNIVYDIGSETQLPSHDEAPKIRGSRGTRLDFKIVSSLELQTSTFLFERLGTQPSSFPDSIYAADNKIAQNNLNTRAAAGELMYVDSIVRITGVTTGVSTDINVRFLKCTGCTATFPT